jgi:hypothetical protein
MYAIPSATTLRGARAVLAVLLAVELTSCASLSRKEKGAVIGAAAGGAVGGVLGNQTGSTVRAPLSAPLWAYDRGGYWPSMDQQAKELQQNIPGQPWRASVKESP